jgi:ribonuclease P protein component
MLLSKAYYLKKTWEFKRVIEERKKVSNENFIIFFSRFNNLSGNWGENKESYKIGISIPQRIVKKAVLRNKYKRQLKAIIFELIKGNKNFLARFFGYRFVLVIREKFKINSFKDNKESLRKIFGFLNWRVNKTLNVK